MSKAFQFVIELDGVCLATQGLVQEWNLPPYFFPTELGLVTQGLFKGKGDFWQYADTAQDAGWVEDDI